MKFLKHFSIRIQYKSIYLYLFYINYIWFCSFPQSDIQGPKPNISKTSFDYWGKIIYLNRFWTWVLGGNICCVFHRHINFRIVNVVFELYIFKPKVFNLCMLVLESLSLFNHSFLLFFLSFLFPSFFPLFLSFLPFPFANQAKNVNSIISLSSQVHYQSTICVKLLSFLYIH